MIRIQSEHNKLFMDIKSIQRDILNKKKKDRNMHIQKSFDNKEESGLYVVPTPIGNLDDITFRAIKVLKSAHIIAAEDTRNTRKLLNYFDINTPLISYHEHSKQSREDQIINKLKQGEIVALVSDAGMPVISDPGSELIKSAIQEEINVIVLPGANAALCALVGSGLETDEFLFYGFLPRNKKQKVEELNRLKQLQSTLILYESPHRIKETLKLLYKELGNRRISIAREITKLYEEYIRGTLEEIKDWAQTETFKGEFCLVISGNDTDIEDGELWWSHLSVEKHVRHYEEEKGLRTNDAIKQVAIDRKMNRREVYQIVHIK